MGIEEKISNGYGATWDQKEENLKKSEKRDKRENHCVPLVAHRSMEAIIL